MIHQSNEWCDNFYNNSRQSFPIHLGCTWNCVTGLTVLLWENHFHFPLVLSVSLPPSLLLCLFWMSLLPCFPIQQVEESTLSHTLGVCFTLELHLSVTLSSLVPETPAKLQHFLLYPTLPGQTTPPQLCTDNRRTNTGLKRYVTKILTFLFCFIMYWSAGCFNCSTCSSEVKVNLILIPSLTLWIKRRKY